MRFSETGGTQCIATSAPLPFSTRQDPAPWAFPLTADWVISCEELFSALIQASQRQSMLDEMPGRGTQACCPGCPHSSNGTPSEHEQLWVCS